MAIEKVSVVDQITVTENGIVMWRIAHRIVENGEVLSQAFERSSLEPGQNTDHAPASVQAIAKAAWTSSVVKAFKDAKAAAAA